MTLGSEFHGHDVEVVHVWGREAALLGPVAYADHQRGLAEAGHVRQEGGPAVGGRVPVKVRGGRVLRDGHHPLCVWLLVLR